MKKEKLLELPLGDRMKYYEAQSELEISPKEHIIVRIDGHKFSKYTKGFQKPFDRILSEAMELTTKDLVEEFNAVTGYTQSDEITLVIPSLKDNTKDNRESKKHKLHKCIKENWKHEFSGRVQKMSSLIAAFATMRFNINFLSLIPKVGFDYPSEYDFSGDHSDWLNYIGMLTHKKAGKAWFDARVYGVPTREEAFNSVLWRVRDAEKNSRSMFAQAYCSHKSLLNLTGKEQVDYCYEKTGKDWNNIEDRYKYGILVKKEQYTKKGVSQNPKTPGLEETVVRTKLVAFSKHLEYSDENTKLIMSKYLGK